jgi:hypothetical protein
VRAQSEVVVLLSCKPREVVHDDEVDLALVRAAVLQEILQFAPVGRLGALALFLETLEDFEALAPTVLLASAKLCRRTEILGLLFRADANVDHRADHLGQPIPVSGRR